MASTYDQAMLIPTVKRCSVAALLKLHWQPTEVSQYIDLLIERPQGGFMTLMLQCSLGRYYSWRFWHLQHFLHCDKYSGFGHTIVDGSHCKSHQTCTMRTPTTVTIVALAYNAGEKVL